MALADRVEQAIVDDEIGDMHREFIESRDFFFADKAKIGMLFIDFVTPNRMRVQATAALSDEEALVARYPGALTVVKATVERVFLNCARYIHKHERILSSPYVPDDEGNQPYPSWKRIDFVQDALRPEDQGRADQEGGVITMEDYGAKLAAGDS
ncbi:MAG: hypothetical protein AAGD35_22720 [Actinomycetota bacterium]